MAGQRSTFGKIDVFQLQDNSDAAIADITMKASTIVFAGQFAAF